MLEIEYTASPVETSKATVDFMLNRPMLAIMYSFMRFACFLLIFGFAITFYNHATRPQDFVAVGSALTWLLFYKKFNQWLVKRSLHLRNLSNVKHWFKIDDQSIVHQIQSKEPKNIEWKKLKYVLKNKDVYIIPLTGLANAGKFLMIPQRSLQENGSEGEFLSIISKFKLKLKNI